MDPIDIREARTGDGAACADLWVAFGSALAARMPGFREPARDGLDRWFEGQIGRAEPGTLRLLAFDDGAPVGYAFAVLRPPTEHPEIALRDDMGAHRAILEDIVVAEAARGRGIGGALLDHIRDWARTHGARSLMLHSDPDGPVRRFYERHGFTVVSAMYSVDL
jgi:GNAT superfamily N-acetyltransferase